MVGQALTAANLGWQPVFGLLSLVYFGLHYMFASQTAHVGALYSAFLAMMLSAGARLCAVGAGGMHRWNTPAFAGPYALRLRS